MTQATDTRKRTSFRMRTALTGVALLAAIAPSAARSESISPGQESPFDQASYRAVYDLELMRASQKTGINAAEGRIVMEIRGSVCTGWTSQTRMVVAMHFRRRSTRLTDSRDTAWEAASGDVFRYSAIRYVNGIKSEDYSLVATRPASTAPVRLRFKKPRRAERTLPAGTLFPMQATARLIAAAGEGRQRLVFPIYEGYEDGEAREVVAAISAPLTAPSQDPGAKALAALQSWHVSLAYYRPRSRRGFGLPEYEVIFRLFENGAVSDVVLDYGDYALKGTLVRYEPLPKADCTAPARAAPAKQGPLRRLPQ